MDFKEKDRAIYLQIADRICDEVLSGALRPGERIPSVRSYAAAIEVNANTAMRAYDYLSGIEVIFNRRGIGYFVSENAPEKIRETTEAGLRDKSSVSSRGHARSFPSARSSGGFSRAPERDV